MTILIPALALLLGPGKVARGEEIYVRIDRSVPVERLAALIRPMGLIESRERGTSVYLIRLNPGVEDDKAKQRLAKTSGIYPLDADEEPVDMNSVKSLDRKISHLTADEKQERIEGHAKAADHEKEKADYLKAYRYFVARRAFPNDRIDWTGYTRAQAQVGMMQPTAVGWSGKGPKPAAAQTWSFVGPTNLRVPYNQYYGISPVNGRVNAVAFDPNNSQTIYAGAAQGGLWKSTDSGSTWTWLSSSWTQLGVNCIVIDPTDSSVIYVGRGDYHGFLAGSYGIMKTTDGGSTWTEISSSTTGQVGVARILMDPTNSRTLIAGTGDTNSYGLLYRSTDAGTTWKKLAVGGTDFTWPALAASAPVSGKTRFFAIAAGIATSSGGSSRVYKSDDHGATWQLLPSQLTTDGNFHWAYAVATSPNNPNNVYILDSENELLFSSTNQGGSWTNVSSGLPKGSQGYNFSQSFYNYHIEVGTRTSGATTKDILFLGQIDLTESADGGSSWVSLGGPTYSNGGAISHNDQHCLAICPTNPNLAICGNDGGVYSISYNPSSGVNTVTPLNQNLGISMFYKLAMHPTNQDFMLGGTQDNASPLSKGDLANWLNVGGGDGGGSAINQTNPLIEYTTSEDMFVTKTSDAWNTHTDIPPLTLGSENLPFVAAMVLDPSNQFLMYTGTNFLYQWNENSPAILKWTNRLGNQDLTNQTSIKPTVQAIAVAPTDSNRIYTGSDDAALWMTTNQGSTWKHLNVSGSGLPNQAITSISVSPTNSSDILVGLSGTGQSNPHLFRCQNTAALTPVFTSVSGAGTTGLPDIPLNAIARDLDNPASTWWVAMDVGVFQTMNSGATWTNAGSALGLPNVIVDDLVAVPGTRYLNAGTYGRGAWRLLLPPGQLIVSLTNFVISPSSITPGATSTGTVTISSAAPAGGTVVNLSSSSSSVATLPSTVTVAAGSTTADFTITAGSSLPGPGTSTIGATYNGLTLTQDLTVSPPSVTALSLAPTSVLGGTSSIGTVTISSAAGPNGQLVTLSSSNASASVPATVTVQAGATTANFNITTSAVTAKVTATITAKLGSSSKAATLIVNITSAQSLSILPTTVIGGSQTPVTGTVTLNGPAPSVGATVTLSSSNTKAATVPASVKVSGGSTTATFTVKHLTVTSSQSTTIKATYGGVSQAATLTATPIAVSSLSISPTSVVGGAGATGTVTLNAAIGSGSKAIAVSLKSTLSAATVPATVTVAIGSSTGTFAIKTTAVKATTTATVRATLGSPSQIATLAIQAPTLVSMSVAPTSVQGSAKTVVTGTVRISSAAPVGGLVISLKSSNTSAATVPASVTIASGKLTGTFTVTHKKVTIQATATITGTLNAATQTADLTITP